MCTTPITIKNPRKRFIPYVDKKYFKVPCGHCLECRNRKRNELYMLSYFEYLNAKYKGGFTQFFTLTYNDDYLPTFGNIPFTNIPRPCFSRDDIQKYFYRVTSACKRAFGNDFKFRRLVTCEYGTINKRPHYHILLFVQMPCNHFKFRQILKNAWSFGFSFGSWDNFGEVNRPNGIRYVTKYVCKDMFDDSDEKLFLDSLDDKDIPERLRYQARKHTTFTLHSKQYGYCALDHILKDSSNLPKYFLTDYETIYKTGCITVPSGPSGIPTTLPLPRTLYRRLFYYSTYRYRRVTKRDIIRCEQHGTKVPKHKVQQFYIPNVHYKQRFPFELQTKLNNAKDKLKLYTGVDSSRLACLSVVRPPFSNLDHSSTMSDNDLFNKLLQIKCDRDPVFKRDPFTKEFFYDRAPLERTDFPDIREKLYSMYNYTDAQILRVLDWKVFKDSVIADSQNRKIEKTYRDNKAFCA